MKKSEISKTDKVVGVVFAALVSIVLAGLACYAILAIVLHFSIFNGLIGWAVRSAGRVLAGLFLGVFSVLMGCYLNLMQR